MCSVPDVSVISGNVKIDGPSNWSTENNRLQLKKHRNGMRLSIYCNLFNITVKSTALVSRHKESLPLLKHEQQIIQRQHEKGVQYT